MNYPANLRNLHFGDVVNIVFYLFLTLIALIFFQQIKIGWLLVLFNLFVVFFIVYVAVGWEGSGNPDVFSGKRFIREWYLVPLILLTFKEIYFFINLLNLPDYDWILIKIDYMLLGAHPTYVLSKFAAPVLTEILQIAYSTFYFLPIILAYDFYRRGDIKGYRYVMGTVVYGFYLSYIGYLLVPAIGPRFTLHDFLKLDEELPGLFLTKALRLIINTGESIPPGVPNPADYAQRDAFPSGHTQITLVVMYLSVVLNSKTKYFLLPTGILLIFSTVYLRYHYVIDLIVGFLFAIFTVTTSPYLFNQCETKIGLRDAGEDQVQAVCSSRSELPELTLRSIFLGVIMAVVLGAANTYIGLKAGMTISATFPAAVVAMAVMRILRGSILEENTIRTTASVGEALAAGAIFTIPAFIISGVWNDFNYWESTVIMLIGGVLGVLFIIVLRRPLVNDPNLPYPESVACAEMVKAGQKGETGAKYVFSMMGVSALIELFKNNRGIKLFEETISGFIELGRYKIQLLSGSNPVGTAQTYTGGVFLSTPVASPALIGVGYIIGPSLSAVAFSGGVLGWWLFIPLAIFFNIGIDDLIKGGTNWESLTNAVWYYQVRPIAVGAMIVGAFHTLWGMRKQLFQGIARGIRDASQIKVNKSAYSRLEDDLPITAVIGAIVLLIVPVVLIYFYFTKNLLSAVIAGVVMTLTGFLFSAVAGYLVGVMGGSNNPISGLTLSSLVISAVLMVALGVKGSAGVEVVLGVAAVVCSALGIAGDMLQDLKVGQLLGGTPRKMQIAEIIGVIFTALVLVFPMAILHKGTEEGIGGKYLPAPQAGLMSVMSKGIVNGEIAWPLIIFGGVLAFALILLKTPSPTLIAVGMYLPFETTSAIFVGGLIKYVADLIVRKKAESELVKIENRGILLASGLVAGESIMGVLLAGLYLLNVNLPHISENPFIGLLVFPLVALILIFIPMGKTRR